VRYSATNKALAVVDTFLGTWGPGVEALMVGAALLAVAVRVAVTAAADVAARDALAAPRCRHGGFGGSDATGFSSSPGL